MSKRLKRQKRSRPQLTKGQRIRRSLARWLLVSTLAGTCVGVATYHKHNTNANQVRQDILEDKRLNVHPDKGNRILYADALSGDTKLRKALLGIGGDIAADFQWYTLKYLYMYNNIPFICPHVDIESPDFLGPAFLERMKGDEELKVAAKQWLELRRDALKLVKIEIEESEDHLLYHVRQEIWLEAELRNHDEFQRTLVPFSLQCGFGWAAGVFGFGILSFLFPFIRRKSSEWLWSFNSPKPKKKPSPPPEPVEADNQSKANTGVEEKKPQNNVTRKRFDTTGSYRYVTKRKGNGKERKKLFRNARNELAEVIGDEEAKALLKALGKKASMRMLRDMAEQEFSSLISKLERNKKMLEQKDQDVDGILAKLRGEEPDDGTLPEIHETERKRPPHELDLASRKGWTPKQFHNLLNRYGFDTSKKGGGGHYFIRYNREKVRYSTGRPVVIPHRTSETEITPGLAGNVLKACADFLVLHEQ